MKLITIACLVLFNVVAYSQSFREALKDLNIAKVTTKEFYYETTFNPAFGEVLFPVQVNGNTLMFSIDTGAPNLIPQTVQDAGKYSVTGKLEMTDSSMDIVTAKSFAIGPIQFEEVKMLVQDMGNSPSIMCSGGNLLGTGVLNEAVWHIDLRQKKLIITDDIKKLDLKRAERYKVNLNKYGQPLVTVKINGKPVELLFDLGHDYPIELDAKTALYINPQKFKNVYGARTENVRGVVIDTNFVFNGSTITIGKTAVKDIPVFISRQVNIPAMGFPMLKNYKVTLNLGKREIYFEPYEEQPEPWQTFGYFPVFENGKLRIAAIYQDSAADRTGLKTGDEIVALNGKPVDCADYCGCLTFFRNYPVDEKEQLLTVNQDGSIRKVKLTKQGIYK